MSVTIEINQVEPRRFTAHATSVDGSPIVAANTIPKALKRLARKIKRDKLINWREECQQPSNVIPIVQVEEEVLEAPPKKRRPSKRAAAEEVVPAIVEEESEPEVIEETPKKKSGSKKSGSKNKSN